MTDTVERLRSGFINFSFADREQAADEITRLRAENEKLEKRFTDMAHDHSASEFKCASLGEENEALRKDAERYRWVIVQESGDELYRLLAGYYETKEDFDAAIDAAMKGQS